MALCPNLFLRAQWQQSPAPGILEITGFQKIGPRLYASTTNGPFYSDDDGLLWHKRNNAPGSAVRTFGQNLYTYSSADVEFYKSTDGGASWQSIAFNLGFLGQSITDFTVINDTIFATNRYKVWRNDPGSSVWTIVYENVQFGDLQLSNENGYLWVTKKQILRSTDQGNNWLNVGPAGVTVNYSSIHGDTLLVSNQGGGISYSFDKGNSWAQRGNPPEGALNFTEGAYTLNSFGVVYLSKDEGFTWKNVYPYNYPARSAVYSNGALILGTQSGCLRSIDEGEHFLFSNADLVSTNFVSATLGPLGNLTKTSSNQLLSFDKGDHWFGPFLKNGILDMEQKADTLFALSIVNKTLHRSWQSLAQWDTLPLNTIPGTPEQIASTPEGLYLLTLVPPARQVYRSADGGESWALRGDTQLLIINFIAKDTVLFSLTTDGNIYVSKDKGQTWNLKISGIDYPINDIFVSGNYVYAYRYNTYQGVFYVSTDYGENWTVLPATIERSVSYAALDNRVFHCDIKGDVYVINGPSDNWKIITDNLPPGITQSALTVDKGQTLMLLDLNQNRMYRRELSSLQGKNLKGFVFNDLNQNGIRDLGENGVPYQVLRAEKGKTLGSTGLNGYFQLTTSVLPDTLRVYPFSPYAQVTPPYKLATQPLDSLYLFAMVLPPGFADLRTDVSIHGALRPGFKAVYHLSVQNVGTDTLSAAPKLWLGPDISLLEANPPIDHITDDTIFWPVRAFAPQSLNGFTARVKLSPNIPVGSTITSVGIALPDDEPDLTPLDNVFSKTDTVYGPYDPNFKEAFPSKLSPADVAAHRPLYYTIHFQNVGNLPATIVRVVDTLSQRLDPASFELVAASHPVQPSMRDKGILEFTFDNINLPDSARDQAGSQGFVKFKITPKPGLHLGDSIVNRASIYFDYNPAVHTNRNVVRVTQVSEVQPGPDVPELTLLAFPNPFKETLQLELHGANPAESWLLQLFDESGKMVYSKMVHGSKSVVSSGTLSSGGYYALAYTIDGKLIASCWVIKGP